MRTLLVGALAATLAGCSSHSLPQSVALTRTDANGFSPYNKGATGRSVERRSTATVGSPIASRAEKPSFARASIRNRVGTKPVKSTVIEANAELPAAGRPAAKAAAGSNARTVQDQVTAAMAVAERMTTATAVALVMASPEIKSVSDLTNKNIAIDSRLSASNSNVRNAIVSAGAADVQLSEAQTGAIDRVISGTSPAAVLTLVSPEAAEQFPDVTGYKIFRIQLSRSGAK
jgi:hypothetical protein